MRKRLAIVLAATAGIGLVATGTAAVGDPRIAQLFDGANRTDWPAYGATFGEQHYSPLAQVNAGNVAQLGLAWKIDLDPANTTSQPLAVNGVVYYVTGYSMVHAADARTGKLLWTHDTQTPEKAIEKLGVGWGPRGIAWWKGKIYVGTQDGRLVAIDARTGKEVWSQQTLDPKSLTYITGAPRVFDGKVVIGFGGADVGPGRGYVTTYDAETGKQLWRFFTVPGNPANGFEDEAQEMAAKTWTGEWWKYGGGGTVWNAMTYDPETDTVFIGTGNGGPWNQRARSPGGGDNLFLCAIVALDAKTGKYKWHYQINPGETWDYNAAMDMPLATLMIDGRPRKVIMQAPKNGFFYVIDRITGKLISAEPFAKVSWASKIDVETGRPVEAPGARYPDGTTFELWPSNVGAHSWQPMAMSPKTGLVYIPVIEKSMTIADLPDLPNWKKYQPDGTGQTAALANYSISTVAPDNTTRLDAWDPAKQKRVWSQPTMGLPTGGVMATGGNLVFQGQLDGYLRAYAADSGKLLWSYDAKAPVMGSPMTYSVGGTQYVTVMTGFSNTGAMMGETLGRYGIDYRTMARRLLTFAIGKRGTLPARIPYRPVPFADADFKADKARAEHGSLVFNTRCMQCHGINAVAAGGAPDLRVSQIPLSAEAFHGIVKGGALLRNGMPRFDSLSDSDVEDARFFVRTQAAAWRAATAAQVAAKK